MSGMLDKLSSGAQSMQSSMPSWMQTASAQTGPGGMMSTLAKYKTDKDAMAKGYEQSLGDQASYVAPGGAPTPSITDLISKLAGQGGGDSKPQQKTATPANLPGFTSTPQMSLTAGQPLDMKTLAALLAM